MQQMFRKYIEQNSPKQTEVYELKICKGTSLPFNHLADHQIEALLQASKGLFYKIPDQPVSWGANTKMRFAAKKPFDCLFTSQAKAYVVVWFYKPRQKKVFYRIPIQSWLNEQSSGVRKSLTENKAIELGSPLYI